MSDIARQRRLYARNSVIAETYVPLWLAAGIHVVTLELDSLAEAAQLLAEIDESAGVLRLAQATGDRQVAKLVEVVLAPSALAFDDLDSAYLWAELGARICCLAYNLRNPFCDGVGERRDGGLSTLGRALVGLLDALDILIDVSHLSDASLADLFDVSERPLLATHSNARALCANPRNLTDDQAVEIARRGGLLGVSVHPTLVAEREASIEHYVDHICYFADLVGIEHVALGADFIGFALDIVAPKLARSDPDGTIYRPDTHEARGLQSYENLARIPALLAERGFSEHDVALIAHENYLRVLHRRSND